MKRKFFLALYYSLLRWLPDNGNLGFIGRASGALRRWACGNIFPSMGTHMVVYRGAYFGNGADMHFGDYASLGLRCHVQGMRLRMGNYVMMAPDVLFLGGGHRIDDLNTPMGQQGDLEKSTLVIGDDVWIGRRAIILGNVKTIGHGAVIGAGAVVTKPVPDYAIVAGNPARVVKYRDGRPLE